MESNTLEFYEYLVYVFVLFNKHKPTFCDGLCDHRVYTKNKWVM